ncbi:fluoride efflux transporter CrcB [Ramlibacter sp.]|uniref:fluoride efflux transporter CrcB n=1 Tax=Ramlibacter sp. TaxID=1917967 RepID=UPI003D0EDA4A
MDYLLVFLGGGIGAMLRHASNGLSLALWGAAYPWGTLFINVSGSLLMGVVVELAALKIGMPPHVRLFIATGILGGYTTFSTFSLEAGLLHARGDTAAAIAYAVGSVVLGVAGFFAGMHAVRALAS